MNIKQQFLLETVGIAGVEALQRVIDKYPILIDYICKSAIDSWFDILSKNAMNNPILGETIKQNLLNKINLQDSNINQLNETNLKNLNKNIDLLVKSQFISSILNKKEIKKIKKKIGL